MTKELLKGLKILGIGNKLALPMIIVAMIMTALLEVIGVGIIPIYITTISGSENTLVPIEYTAVIEEVATYTNMSIVMTVSIAVIAIYIIKNSFIVALSFWMTRYIMDIRYRISSKLMETYMYAPYTLHLQRNSAELLRNVNEEINVYIYKVLLPLMNSVKLSVVLIGITTLLMVMEPVVTMLTAVFVGLISILFLRITQSKMKKYGIAAQKTRKNMIKTAIQGFSGIKEIIVANKEEYMTETFKHASYELSVLQKGYLFTASIPKPLVETISIVGIMILSITMYLMERGTGEFVPLIALFGVASVRMMPAIQQITQAVTTLRYSTPSINPIYNDINSIKAHKETRKVVNSERIISLKRCVRIEDVKYKYPDSVSNAIDGVTVNIQKGTALGIVGESGAGKTTMVDLLLGVIKPDKGKISIDENNMWQDIRGWQSIVGYIPQKVYIIDDSIMSNVAFGVAEDEIDQHRVLSVLRSAKLDEHVRKLPGGINTVIGERGDKLSGGQIQRIGIARALYSDPEVIVMDEATSSLDSITERSITDTINNIKGIKTFIIIAHRLTTVKQCDNIIYMNNGKVVDSGTYDELIEKNANFAKLASAGNQVCAN